MRRLRSSGRWSIVRSCAGAASLTRMTRMSSTIASSILQKFSAWRASLKANGMARSWRRPRRRGRPRDRTAPRCGRSWSGRPRPRHGAGRRRWPPRPAACRPAGWPLRGGAPGRARRSGGLALVLQGRERRRPASRLSVGVRGTGPTCGRDREPNRRGWCLTSVGPGADLSLEHRSDPTRPGPATRRPPAG